MVIIEIYKGVYNRESITRESEIPSSITKLRNYFYILYPNTNGGNCNPLIKIDSDGQEQALKEEAEYELRKNGIYLWKIRTNMDQLRINTTSRTFQMDAT